MFVLMPEGMVAASGRRESIAKLRAPLTLVLGAWFMNAAAHDFWLEPSAFRPAPGAEVAFRIYVGQDFRGNSMIYLPEVFERYVYVGPEGEKTVPGLPGDDPAGKIRPSKPGLITVGYRSANFTVDFDTLEEFERYLKVEGLEHIAAVRQRLGKPARNITETYSRSAKSLLAAGAVKPGGADRRLGFTMELIAERNPYELRAGAALPVRLLYRDHPLPDALVTAFTKDAPLEKLRARTDKAGRVTLQLPRPGVWLITSVHMVPTPRGASTDWESIWASLTFELAPG